MTSEIYLDVKDLDAFAKRVNEAGDTIARISINEGLRRLGHLITPPLRAETPVRTGKLARSTVFQIIGGAMNQALEIRQAAQSPEGVYYGYIVREGRGPVFAKKAKYLHFFIGGKEFFRKSVGPAAANPYHIRVLERFMPQIQEVVNDMAIKIVAYISGQ
jgi:hypothetical protein